MTWFKNEQNTSIYTSLCVPWTTENVCAIWTMEKIKYLFGLYYIIQIEPNPPQCTSFYTAWGCFKYNIIQNNMGILFLII